MSVSVGMLDLTTLVLHAPGSVHLRARCGVDVEPAMVGPLAALMSRNASTCRECYGALAFLLDP